MKIVFVRHGHPNYQLDCLTELGKRHAQAAADRLTEEGIEEIYASTLGRAMETAQIAADKLGISQIVPCEFMQELPWGPADETILYENGHPWFTAQKLASENISLLNTNWQTEEPYCHNLVAKASDVAVQGFDTFLAELGYQREGLYYRVGKNTHKTIAVFSHGGSSSAVIGHMMNLPFPYMCALFPQDFTAITILTLSDEEGQLVSPKVELYNDARHIRGIENHE